ncbi:MAG: nucleoid-associated bacterial family protein [Streptococcus pyogenes]|nr:MAG: nucleoid-associated bacterial family protein [Streptococcus pyogenes]
MLDIYIKQIIIHQFSPSETELTLAEMLVTISPRIDDYFRKKLTKVFSEDAKRGQFESDNAFLTLITDDIITSSQAIAKEWKEAFVFAEDQKTNDLVFLQFEKEGQPYFAFLRMTLKESLAHNSNDPESPFSLSQNTLPNATQAPDEALVINLATKHYYLIEKRIKHNGSFENYFSQNLLKVTPDQSVKKSIKTIEQTAQKIAEGFQKDDFAFQSKLKSSLHQQLDQGQELSPEKLADQLFDDNLTARLTFVDQLKEAIPHPISVSDIDYSRQSKKLESQKLSLSNGIELTVPNAIYQDAESVEFILNDDGTYSILIKNIEDIQNK